MVCAWPVPECLTCSLAVFDEEQVVCRRRRADSCSVAGVGARATSSVEIVRRDRPWAPGHQRDAAGISHRLTRPRVHVGHPDRSHGLRMIVVDRPAGPARRTRRRRPRSVTPTAAPDTRPFGLRQTAGRQVIAAWSPGPPRATHSMTRRKRGITPHHVPGPVAIDDRSGISVRPIARRHFGHARRHLHRVASKW